MQRRQRSANGRRTYQMEEANMRRAFLSASAALAVGISGQQVSAQDAGELTLCWAAWDPANALTVLSEDFTEQTGIQMNFEFVPWTSFADRFLNELNSGGQLCDLMIGDSQWLGGTSATYGHYIKLNDFFERAKASRWMTSCLATVYAYSTWPKGEPRVLGVTGDGRCARLGLSVKTGSNDPNCRQEFQGKIRPRSCPAVPKNWNETQAIMR